ncbi:LysR family transcriptional regulator [Kribbella sp. NPDC048915]|uniref:LysR family transcriptional regulator n=1 Tax=Kribbella sp. NPDC048915 TaxID=3155148 RepID=UPI0033D62760
MEGTPGHDSRPEPLPWDDVQYFLELARRRTLAKASLRLGVAHTTVLRRVASLERRLDRKLFDRSHSGFDLTSAGQELLHRAEEMESVADTIFSAGGERGRVAGTVRVAIVEGLAHSIVVPALRPFHVAFPDVRLELITVMQLANLTRRDADIAVGLSRPSGSKLYARKVAQSHVHLYASTAYLAEHGTPATVSDLDRHFFVDYVEDMIEIQALRWLADVVGSNRVVFRSTSPLVQLAAVRSGLGIGMFPTYLTRDEPDFVRLLPDEVCAHREFWAAVHQDLLRLPRMQSVFDFLIHCLTAELEPES